MSQLRKQYEVPVSLLFSVFDKYDTVQFVCGVCKEAIPELRFAKLIFSRDTGIARVVCAVKGREGCSHVTKSMCPQSTDLTPLIERMVRRNGEVTR